MIKVYNLLSLLSLMSTDVEADYTSRNRSYSHNPNDNVYATSNPKSSFKIAGKLVLEQNYSSRAPEVAADNDQNSLQNMKSSVLTSKTTKISDFVHLPKVRFEENSNPPTQIIYSQQTIDGNRPLLATNNHSIPSILTAEEQNSVIIEHHQKLSGSENHPEEDAWNIQKLQMALDYVELQQAESPLLNRNPKRRTRREKEKDLQKERQRQRVRRERERNMEMVSGFLSGKATFMWLFILGGTDDEAMTAVRDIYKTYLQNDYEVPICKNYNEAIRFLKIQSCFFKIVSDLPNAQLLISETQHNNNIISIYLYNPQKEKGIGRAFEIKRTSRKVRGMFMELGDAAQLAEEQIENEAKFIKVGQQLERERNRLRFPAFFILNGIDNTDVTSYRMCLYGSLSIKEEKERELYLKEFTDMVELRYANNQGEMRNLVQYKKIDHITASGEGKHRQVLGFYVKESFYYALINAMLRLSRNAEEFRPCVIPFNQTYLAIKHFYKQSLQQSKYHPIKFTAYRGAKLRRSDVKSLHVGSLIELLGFTSTSLKIQQAKKFMDNDSYLIEIVVETTASDEQELDYDHGFIDINKYKLAAAAFEEEEEILFNALNVYRVTALDLESAVRKITLSYGAVVALMRSKHPTPAEVSVLENYRHCVASFKLIEDDGDALRLAQEHDQCVSYYQAKIQSGQGNARSYGKLAGAQLEVGDIDAAYDNAIRSLAMIEQEGKHAQLTPAYKVPLQLNSRVFDEREDVVSYERSTNLYLSLLDWEEKCRLLSDRAEKKLDIGNYKGCLSDLKLAQEVLKLQEESFQRRRGEVKRKYFFAAFCCLCSAKQFELEEAREMQLLKVEQDQILFESKREARESIRMRLQVIMKDLSLKIGDQQEYEQCLLRAQQQFQLLSSSFSAHPATTYFQLAHLQLMQAHTLDLKVHFAQYEELVEQAIENIRMENPLHPDIAKYSEILGLKRYDAIQQNLNIPSSEQKAFDYEHHKLMYKKCRGALLEAVENLGFHKGATHRRTVAVHNHLATLDYDFSLLKQAEDRMQPTAKLEGEAGSEGSKCHILLAKIALAKGELKRASIHIEKATALLKNSLLKQSSPEYDKVMLRHPLYLEISILRAKVYNRQQKHQLALKELQMLQRLVKLQKPYNVALLANLEEEEAEILVCLGETQNFESCVLRSVRLREQAMGKFNIPNAISFSNLFKYLRYTSDFDNSVKYHQKSTEIFSRFPPDHPNAWVLHLSNGLIFFQRRQFQQALPELEAGLRIAERRYSPSHINFMKIRLQFAKLLKSMGQLDRALRILESLDTIISKNIRESTQEFRIEQETDDEKITVRKNILVEMKELYERSRTDKNLGRTMLALERCQVSLRECEEFVSNDEKIDSLKSLT